jgi:hypothetical protein
VDFVFANAGIAQGPAELLEDHLDADGKLKAPSTKIVDINLVGVIYSMYKPPDICSGTVWLIAPLQLNWHCPTFEKISRSAAV